MRDAAALAKLIGEAFADYHAQFAWITQRARRRFEQRHWNAARADAVERIALYDACVDQCRMRLQAVLGQRAFDRALWQAIRDHYATLIQSQIDCELYKTFYNTLSRRFFRTRGVDAQVEFVALDIAPTDAITHPVARHSYAVSSKRPTDTFERVLGDYAFDVPYAHRTRCAAAVAVRLQDDLAHWGQDPARAIELLDTVFYRERRAYLVGRVLGESRFSPCVIALVNDEAGLRVDAVLTRRVDVAQLFGISRSYFHADLPTVGDAVVFLRTLLPHKPIDELYTVLGRAKQGKTERFRTFFSHFNERPGELLTQAEGTPGMVMAVFTLPSYPLVFKLIRDRFAESKQVTRQDVLERYALVFNRDRVGRLLDAQPYRWLRFPVARFAPGLLEELRTTCAGSLVLEGDQVIIALCYVQRRLRPLNLYLREQTADAARAAVLEYGQAIVDMARNNIFPGDMLLKNFGVSRHGRVVFYDYDEVRLITDCRFRDWPKADNYEDQLADEPWFQVSPGDVFPERFAQFMGLPQALARTLQAVHGQLFDAGWWRALQAELAQGRYPDTPPYPPGLRVA